MLTTVILKQTVKIQMDRSIASVNLASLEMERNVSVRRFQQYKTKLAVNVKQLIINFKLIK